MAEREREMERREEKMKQRKALSTYSRGSRMREGMFDLVEEAFDRATAQGEDPYRGVQEVFDEAAILATKGVIQPNNRERERQLREQVVQALPEALRPQGFPHYRRAHNWREMMAEAAAAAAKAAGAQEASTPPPPSSSAPDSFFSKKAWSSVYGITPDVVSLAGALQLPRPSRIQNLTYYDLVNGNNVVVADMAGSGKTLAYLLPLLKRHVFVDDPSANRDYKLKLLILAPTADLAEQIMTVARVVSVRSKQRFRVHCCTGGHPAYDQRKNLQSGTDVLVGTPGRLKYFMFEDDKKALDLSDCKAVVFDEVDVLLQDEANLTIEDIRQKIVDKIQWVFVTATLGEAARQRLKDFQALPSITPVGGPPKKGLVWLTGPGLHKVSSSCEHVLVDCTPAKLYDMEPEKKHDAVMREKTLALAWHLQFGVMRDVQENRIVIFCNTIDNCREVENALRKMDPRDKRSGSRAWKVLVLHGLRDKEDYKQISAEFNSDNVMASDFFKKKLLVCTDRLSRGIDFSRQPVNWVVLMDWPRDATEYLRRAGRTARGGGRGGVLSFVAGYTELKMAKQVTSAAIRNVRLQSDGSPDGKGLSVLTEKYHVLERFDPTFKNWRAPEAATPRLRSGEDEGERPRQAASEEPAAQSEGRTARDSQRPRAREDVDSEYDEANKQWAPWTRDSWDGKKGVPWEEGGGGAFDDDDDDDYADDGRYREFSGGRQVGVSLSD